MNAKMNAELATAPNFELASSLVGIRRLTVRDGAALPAHVRRSLLVCSDCAMGPTVAQ